MELLLGTTLEKLPIDWGYLRRFGKEEYISASFIKS